MWWSASRLDKTRSRILCFFYRESLYNLVNTANLVHSFSYYVYFFSLRASGDYVPIIRRLDGCLVCIPDSHIYRVTSTKCRIDTDVSPDDGHIVVRNIEKRNKLTMKNCAPIWLYLQDRSRSIASIYCMVGPNKRERKWKAPVVAKFNIPRKTTKTLSMASLRQAGI